MYEFIVRTEHAARLWVNDNQQAADRRLGEVGQRHRVPGDVFLLGGRAYPVRLEFSKAKQGVDDSKKNAEAAAGEAAFDRAGVEAARTAPPR